MFSGRWLAFGTLAGLGLVLAGCASEAGDEGDGGKQKPREVTWHQDVAPIVAGKCEGCHSEGGIGPFTLSSYEDAAIFAPLLADATEARIMPPWGARSTDECEIQHGFKDDLSLTDEEIETFRLWAEQEAPQGDPDTAAELPTPPSLVLDDADESHTIPSSVTVEGNDDQFLCFSVPLGNTSMKWLDGIQVTPGNQSIVHHVLVYAETSGASVDKAGDDGYYPCFGGPGVANANLVAAWAPGATPAIPPENTGLIVQENTNLIINVHYHPTGAGPEVDDSTSVDLRWFDGIPEYTAQLQLIGNFGSAVGGSFGLRPGPNDRDDQIEFRIPAGVADHRETMMFQLPSAIPEDSRLWTVGTHMHYVGTDMLIGVKRFDPPPGQLDEECLVQTPQWDFNWQRGYSYDAPLEELPSATPGDVLFLRCTYDNSMSNPFVVEALDEQGLDGPIDVELGEETLDEMCLGVFGLAFPTVNVL